MRRPKLGDLYSVKVPNGYKIIQWAYRIEKYGDFIRVFDGLHASVPENLSDIAAGPHSYITSLHVSKASRIGLLDWLGNFPVPEQYPVPEYQISFCRDQYNHIYSIKISKTPAVSGLPRFYTFPVCSVHELPEQYREVKMLHSHVSTDWLLYLFDNDFSLNNPDIFEPQLYWGTHWRDRYQIYIDIIEKCLKANSP